MSKPSRSGEAEPEPVNKPEPVNRKAGNKLWGGRFEQGPAEIMEEINVSLDFDQRLYQQDIRASRAHCHMLKQCHIISDVDAEAIQSGLSLVEEEISRGRFTFRRETEDIHMNIEMRLKELIGESAGRLHTARSRNDQVAVDFRLWVRDAIDELVDDLDDLVDSLIVQAETNLETFMPGYTHLQTAQPVTFAHHMMAYVEMLIRDRSRFQDARKRMNSCPLGAAALAGTSFEIDRFMTAKELGFAEPTRNSIDSVSDRDFALEFMSVTTLLAVHLSRLAEELIVWMSDPFSFITMTDAFTTGSSIMPQKRNPDAAELVRAKSGRISGNFIALVTVMKGLPLSYSKDMQEDKEATFDAADSIKLALKAMAGMVKDMQPDQSNLLKATSKGHITATDLADWLVRELDLPFREAHHVTGRLVKKADDLGVQLPEMGLKDMREVEPGIREDIFDVLTVECSVRSRKSYGGTSPSGVQQMILKIRDLLLDLRRQPGPD